MKPYRPVISRCPTLGSFCCALALTLCMPLQASNDLVFTPAPLPLNPLRAPDAGPADADRKQILVLGTRNAAQQPSALLRQRTLDDYRRKMDSETREFAPYSPELAGYYMRAGRLSLEAGDHDEARDYLGKAEHIYRINYGLHASEQFEPVALSVQSYLDQHDYANAIERQEYLLYLNRRHFGADSTEIAPVMSALGDMYFDTFRRTLSQENLGKEPQLRFGPDTAYVDPAELTQDKQAFLWLWRAQSRYFDTIKTLVDQQLYSHPLLLELEDRLLQTVLLQAYERQITFDRENFLMAQSSHRMRGAFSDSEYKQATIRPRYLDGVEAFERILAYHRAAPGGDPLAVGEALLRLGDWNLLFGYYAKAEQQYAEAHHFLQQVDCRPEQRRHILAPDVPVQLPVFQALEGERNTAGRLYEGYIDVSFKISDIGRVSDIEVLDTEGNIDRQAERALYRELRRAPFRPYLDAGGEALREQKVSLRYHVARI